MAGGATGMRASRIVEVPGAVEAKACSAVCNALVQRLRASTYKRADDACVPSRPAVQCIRFTSRARGRREWPWSE
jgi:hypothetical protein